MDLEIKCSTYKCHSTMGPHDEAYCEGCVQDKDNDIKDLERKVIGLEANIEARDYTIGALKLKIEDLKVIVKDCPTCSAILVAKNL